MHRRTGLVLGSTLPRGAVVTNAYVQFRTAEAFEGSTDPTLHIEWHL
jgi:hypothetical protein